MSELTGDELVFIVEETDDERLVARALGLPLTVEADDEDELREEIRDIVAIHFAGKPLPTEIRLHHVVKSGIEI